MAASIRAALRARSGASEGAANETVLATQTRIKRFTNLTLRRGYHKGVTSIRRSSTFGPPTPMLRRVDCRFATINNCVSEPK